MSGIVTTHSASQLRFTPFLRETKRGRLRLQATGLAGCKRKAAKSSCGEALAELRMGWLPVYLIPIATSVSYLFVLGGLAAYIERWPKSVSLTQSL